MQDLFKLVVDEGKLNENFIKVSNGIGHQAGRKMLNEIYNSVKAIDKDFIVQFQTNGFDSRIWELSLLAAFLENGFDINREHSAPDFELIKNRKKIFVEAVTTNPSDNQKIESKIEILSKIKTEQEWLDYVKPLRNESTMKLASSLTSKLNKKYWEKDWVKGNPLILAVEPFHHSLAQILSDSNISGYLYGFENTYQYDKDKNLKINTHRITSHEHNGKKIESNFFALPNAENISAVIFSNSFTISKFTRMGTIKGYGEKNVVVERKGLRYDHNPNAIAPLPFYHVVGNESIKESWSEGISVFHNPNAKYPISRGLFPNMFHGYFKDYFYSYYPDFWPVNSDTTIKVFQ